MSHDSIPEIALDWHQKGRKVALATVVETWGSAPRPVGSQLVIDENGAMEGSVSGGCVEGAVVVEALDAVQDGGSRLLDYGVSDDEAFAVGLACGGRIRVLVEPVGSVLPPALLQDLLAARAARTPVAYVTGLKGGAPRLMPARAFSDRFRADRSGVEEDGETFVGVHNPPLKMFVIGAVHIAQTLLPMARACGHDTVLIDPRPAFAAKARFPGETIMDDWPDEALAAQTLDARSSVVTLTHDPKLDDPAIMAALGSDVFYLGCLGSKRTHAKRVERLTGAGLTDAQIGRIHGPVGLDIGARSPAEIAVSVLAQATEVLRKG